MSAREHDTLVVGMESTTRVDLPALGPGEVELVRLARAARLRPGLAAEIARCIHDAIERVLPTRDQPPVELEIENGALRLEPAELHFPRVEFDPAETGFEVRRGRVGPRIVRTGAIEVARNGWPLTTGEPASLVDGDAIEAAGKRYGVRVPAPHGRPLVSLGSSRRVAESLVSPFTYEFTLEPAGERLVVVLEPASARALLDLVLDGDGERPFDPTALSEVELAILEWLLHRIANQCASTLFGGRAAIRPSGAREHPPGLWFTHALRIRSHVGAVSLGLDVSGLQGIIDLLPKRGFDRRGLTRARGLPIAVSLRLALGRAPATDLAAIQCGDNLIARGRECWFDSGLRGQAFLALERQGLHALRATVEQRGKTLIVCPCKSRIPGEDQAMDMPHEYRSTPDDGGDLPIEDVIAALGVNVSVEIARRRMLIGDLLNLAGGDVLELAAPVGVAVTLLADGVAFALGELVDVDGYLGVRVTALKGGEG
jgi:flagellar motor switch/type III secretory pathway protein FliN